MGGGREGYLRAKKTLVEEKRRLWKKSLLDLIPANFYVAEIEEGITVINIKFETVKDIELFDQVVDDSLNNDSLNNDSLKHEVLDIPIENDQEENDSQIRKKISDSSFKVAKCATNEKTTNLNRATTDRPNGPTVIVSSPNKRRQSEKNCRLKTSQEANIKKSKLQIK